MGKRNVSRRMAGRSSGFTLIELLVVLVILALLLAILLPVFAHARKKTQQSACVNNLHQLYLACSLYAEDNGGLLPPYPSQVTTMIGTSGCVDDSALLLASLSPYTHSKDIWRCPSDTTHFDPLAITACEFPVLDLTSYRYEGFHLIDHGIQPISLDWSSYRRGGSEHTLFTDSYSCPKDGGYAQYNHDGRWNRIYLDGHAKSYGLDCTNAPLLTETP